MNDLAADIARRKWASIEADMRADVLALGPDRMRDLLACVIDDLAYENADRDKWPVGSAQNPWNMVR